MGDFVEVKGLVKTFSTPSGKVNAVNNVSFGVQKGEFLTLLGPSGCGKTTILRCIAGLERPEGGEIIVEGEVYYSAANGTFIPPNKRNIGMVFQSYAVWPHMNVFDNIAYGLKIKKARRDEIKKQTEWAIELVGLQGLAERPVTKLSGGQQQRVAMARALAYNPKVVLFDEPLSNLDAKLRERMRLELINLQREIGITSIYVTHDQAEAMVISDKVLVMRDGIIEQIGDSKNIYDKPNSKFVADFIGIANFFNGKVVKKSDGKKYGVVEVSDGTNVYEAKCLMDNNFLEGEGIVLFFRPENTNLVLSPRKKQRNLFPGKITKLVYLGNYIDCRVIAGTTEIRAQIPAQADLQENCEVSIEVNPDHCLCLKK